jgi:hypothetical protein
MIPASPFAVDRERRARGAPDPARADVPAYWNTF